MSKKYKGIKIANVIISFFLFMLGIDNLIVGAHTSGNFYVPDAILVRALGVLFITSSLGLFLRKDLARKAAIITAVFSVFETFATFDYADLIVDIPISFLIITIVYGIPLIFLFNQRVKKYFKLTKEEMNKANKDSASDLKASKFGVASFIPVLANIFLLMLDGLMSAQTLEGIVGIEAIYITVSSLIGLIFGITGLMDKNTSKPLSLWGSILNGSFLAIFIFLILAVL